MGQTPSSSAPRTIPKNIMNEDPQVKIKCTTY